MNTIIFLIVVSMGAREAHNISITEMPNMEMCTSIGKSIATMTKYVKWNCIEGPR